MPQSSSITTTMTGCVVITFSTVVRCALPAGQGNITAVSLTVLDQTTTFVVAGIAYDAPRVIASVPSPLELTSDLSSPTTLSGSGFGASPGVVTAWLVVNTTGLCVPSGLVVTPASLTYRSDSEISLQFTQLSNMAFPVGSVVIAVAGQSTTVTLKISAPVVSGLSLDSVPVGGIYSVDIAGSSLGSSYSENCSASSVSIDVSGTSCTSTSVLQVCLLKGPFRHRRLSDKHTIFTRFAGKQRAAVCDKRSIWHDQCSHARRCWFLSVLCSISVRICCCDGCCPIRLEHIHHNRGNNFRVSIRTITTLRKDVYSSVYESLHSEFSVHGC